MDKNVVLTTLEMAGEGRSPGGARRLPEEKAADPVGTCRGSARSTAQPDRRRRRNRTATARTIPSRRKSASAQRLLVDVAG